MNMKVLGAAALVAVMTIGSASAATVTSSFSFNNGSQLPGAPIVFTSDTGLEVTASASREVGGDSVGGTALLGQYSGNSGGLGVCTGSANASSSGGCANDNHQVDSDGVDEFVLFDFDGHEVTIESATFSLINSNDDFSFAFFENGFGDSTDFIGNIDLNGTGIVTFLFPDTFNANLTGTQFGIGASGSGDRFKIRNLVVSYDVATVPLPAAGVLLLSALGGLGFARARRRRS